MGKRNVVPMLPTPAADIGGNQSPLNAALGPIVTAAEYRSAVIALVQGVEDVSDDNQKLLDLSSAARRLLLARYDPPLPLYWTFVALEKSLWLDKKSKDPLGFGTAILDFARRVHHSLISLSAMNASGRTALAAIAPVVGLVYDAASLLSTAAGFLDENQSSSGTAEGNGRQVRNLAKNLKGFIKELLGFRILCLLQDSKTFERSFSLPSAPDVPLVNFPDFIYPAFPLASKDMAKSFSLNLANSAVMAEIVSGEVILLQLVVETIDRRIVLKKRDTNFSVGEDEYFQKLKDLAVHSVWPTNSASPSEMILDALPEKPIPVLDLLDTKEETLVRGVLSDTVLADPPLFSLCADAGKASTSVKEGLDYSSVVFMKKLSVARRAVAFFRRREDLSRLAALETRMKAWHVPPLLLKWLKSQKKHRLPVIAMQDRQALTKWLVKTAEKPVFTAILNKCVASWSSGLTSVGTTKRIEVLEVESGGAHPDRDGEDLFFVDTAGETKAAIDSEAAADLDFTAASKTIKGDSEKMKKKKKSSKVLFDRHEHASTGTKRSRMEIGDVGASSSSGSDSEDSEETGSKSAKKVKKSKRKAIAVYAISEEDEDDDKDGALALEYHGSVGTQQQAELQTPHRTETPKDHGVNESQSFGEVMTGGAAEEEVPKVQQQIVARTLLDDKEVGSQETPSVSSQGTLPLGTSSRSRKGKTAQRFEVTGGVGTEELPSQPEVAGNASVAVTEVDTQRTSTISLEEPVLASAGKSGKKNKKMPKDPEGPDIEAGVAGTEELSSELLEETVNISVSATAVDTQNSLTISLGKPVLLSPGKSAKKKKKSKDPEGPDIEAGVAGTEELSSELLEETVNISVSTTAVDTQNSLTISLGKPVLLSPGKSAKKKKKSKDPEGPHVGAVSAGTEEIPLQLYKEMDNTSTLVTGYPEADTGAKGAAHASLVVITTSQTVETRVEVQGVDEKNLSNEVTTTTGEEVEPRKSSQQASLTLLNENGEDRGEIGDMAARVQSKTLTNIEEETLVVKSSKTKRRKEVLRHGDEVDQIQIFDAIKQELFTASAKLSGADLIDTLQVEKSLQSDHPEGSRNTTSRNKRARSGDDGDSIADVQGTTTREPAATVSVVNSDTMKSGNESTQEGNSSQGDAVLAEILGKGQVEDVRHDESEPKTSKPRFTQVNQPVDSVVFGAQDGSRDTDRLAVQPTNSPTKDVIVQTELRTQGTPASRTSSGSKLKKNRDASITYASRKKRSKDQIVTALPPVADNGIHAKEEVVVVSSETPDILQDEKDQGERSVMTPTPSNVSETEPVTSVKPSSRKRKVKPDISASVESGTTDEHQYQRRTRSGRALGTPPPTPTRKVNSRKKLVLEPLEEDK